MTEPTPKPSLESLLEHGGWVRALAAHLVADPAGAEDLEQKTWLAAVEHPPKHAGNPKAWLASVMRNVAGMQWREQKARQRREQLVAESRWVHEAQNASESQPDRLAERMDTFRKLAIALTELEEPFGTTLFLRFFEELTLREIGERMSVSESAVHARLQRGLFLMQQQLSTSVGQDWRQRCLVFGIPLKTAPIGALSLGLAMTMKTKIASSIVALALVAFLMTTSWVSKDDGTHDLEIDPASTVKLAVVEPEAKPVNLDFHRSVEVLSPPKLNSLVQVSVIDEAGYGVPDVRIIPWVGEELREENTTDPAGQATFNGLEGVGGIAVLAPGHRAIHRVVEFKGEPILVELLRGNSLKGRIEFQKPIADPTTFVLWHISSSFREPTGIPESVIEQLKEKDASLISVFIPLQADGSFEVHGLPSLWNGRLRMPLGFMAYDAEGGEVGNTGRFVHLPKLAQNLVIQVMELPYFSGRVVTPNGLHGVPDVQVVVQPYFTEARDEPGSLWGLGGRSNEAGYFRVPISVTNDQERDELSAGLISYRPYAAEVSLSDCPSWADVEFEKMDLGSFDNPWAMGDFAVGGRSSLAIRVQDENGEAIQGALAKSYALGEPTDENGMTSVFLAAKTKQVVVGAKGFIPMTREIPVGIQGEALEFRMLPAASLKVTWDLPEGVDIGGVHFRMESEQGVFADVSPEGNSMQRTLLSREILDLGWNGGTRKGVIYRHTTMASDQQELYVWGLQPEAQIKILLCDSQGVPFSSVNTISILEGEEKHVNLQWERLPASYSGLVRDVAGHPLGNVEVGLPSPEGGGIKRTAWTGEDGAFRMAGLEQIPNTLRVSKAGYSTLLLTNITPSLNGEPMNLVLEEERIVTIFLRDANGKDYDDGYVGSPGQNMHRTEEARGGYTLKGNSRSAFMLEWQLGGAKGEEQIPAGVSEHVITVPQMASLSVEISRQDATEGRYMKLRFYAITENDLASEEPIFASSFLFEKGVKNFQHPIPSILPGNYEVHLLEWRPGPENYEFKLMQDPITIAASVDQDLSIDFNF